MGLRICLIDETSPGQQQALNRALSRRMEVTAVSARDRWPRRITEIDDYQSYDAFLWRVKFRHLLNEEAFDWGRYEGARLLYEPDACQNYSSLASRQYLGRFPEVVRRNDFHALICTGREVRDRFRAEHVNAHWIPKGYDAELIGDEQRRDREGLCYYGRQYLGREALLARVRQAALAFTEFRCPLDELSERLNRFAGCLICNMEVRGSHRTPMRLLRCLPKRWLSVRPGLEPMAKNFEAAGAGCAPVCDDIPELAELGFADGVTMISYTSFPELIEKVRNTQTEQLRAIGRRAAELARSRHTLDHRAEELEQLIVSGAYVN
jgi:Glycosyl transferases group 1